VFALKFCCSFSANFMDSCPSLCSVPVMHGTRADKTFKNDIYGFGGNAVSSVAQNNLWSFLSNGSWHSIVPSSPQSHLRTSWPQIVPKIHPETKTWDGDTLISVSSNDDAYPELDGAGSLNIMLFSTSRSVWLQPSASAVSMHTSRCNIISEISFFAPAGSQSALCSSWAPPYIVSWVFVPWTNCCIRR
jgi:hypothetical protein